MNVLITCPRAPAVIEWVRVALRGGHHVTVCDSVWFPLGRFVRSEQVQFRRVPSPRLHFDAYRVAMVELIGDADVVIPTCEDIFHLAHVPLSATDRSKCLMPPTETLLTLHHKVEVFTLLPRVDGVAFPASKQVTSVSEVLFDDDSGEKTVLKPVFSRFGREVVRGVTRDCVLDLAITKQRPWVQQRFIGGESLCSFAVCDHGTVVANGVYRPKYLVNNSASTYFEPVKDERIRRFIDAFAERHRFHGQVAFDFIDDGDTLWVLECNPRTTSGLHLIADQVQLVDRSDVDSGVPGGVKVAKAPLSEARSGTDRTMAYRVGATLPLLFGWQAARNGSFRRLVADYRRSSDVLAGLPGYAQWLSYTEMVVRSVVTGHTLSDVSTADIEFGGTVDEAS